MIYLLCSVLSLVQSFNAYFLSSKTCNSIHVLTEETSDPSLYIFVLFQPYLKAMPMIKIINQF